MPCVNPPPRRRHLRLVADLMETRQLPLRDALTAAGLLEWREVRPIFVAVFGMDALDSPNACIANTDIEPVVAALRAYSNT